MSLHTRREWIRRTLAAAAGSAAAPVFAGNSVRGASTAKAGAPSHRSSNLNAYFGDIHNHNAVGYARGGLRRAFEIARNQQIDFYALTPHAYWHDIGEYEGQIEDIWHEGFEVTEERWPDVLAAVREFHDPGSFVTFPGYEWHSTDFGDYHVVFPYEDASLTLPDTLEELQDFVRESGAIMIPHHPANRQGMRGANFDERDPELAPLLEVYSEWGNAVYDRGPYPYIRHSPGGRWTKNTLQYRLAQGDRLGVVASTDDHFGKPAAYHQGLAAVLAPELTRDAVFDAFWNRRTYAVTGDRIDLRFDLNGRPMGSELPFARRRQMGVDVAGWYQVDSVEIWKNNRVIHRDFPQDRRTDRSSWNEPVLVWFEYGWGPWAALDMAGIAEWDVRFGIENGRFEALQPAFQTGPYSEEHRDELVEHTPQSVHLRSYTARRQEFEDHSQKGLALKIAGGPESLLTITSRAPSEKEWSFRLGDLAESNEVLFTGPYPRETALVHRVIFSEHYETSFEALDEDEGDGLSWYYVRVNQANHQYAWSSPIWVEARG